MIIYIYIYIYAYTYTQTYIYVHMHATQHTYACITWPKLKLPDIYTHIIPIHAEDADTPGHICTHKQNRHLHAHIHALAHIHIHMHSDTHLCARSIIYNPAYRNHTQTQGNINTHIHCNVYTHLYLSIYIYIHM